MAAHAWMRLLCSRAGLYWCFPPVVFAVALLGEIEQLQYDVVDGGVVHGVDTGYGRAERPVAFGVVVLLQESVASFGRGGQEARAVFAVLRIVSSRGPPAPAWSLIVRKTALWGC